MPITLKDIAKAAGVNHATVSRALRGSPLISAEVSERIRRMAEEMGYHPSAAARSLKTHRTQVLGVIVSNIADPFFSEIVQGIEEAAQPRGYSLFIAAAQHDSSREQAIVRTMREHRVDGVIISSTPFSAERSRQLIAQGTPIVVINNQSAEQHCLSIYHDDLDGAQQVTRHLIGLGHRCIAYLGNCLSGRTNAERLEGFQREMQAAGLAVGEDCVREVAGGDPEHGLAAVQPLLDLPQRPTAIFCFNDQLAIGALRGLQEAGLRVPQDISLAGFDNILFSAYTNPPLTTLDQPKRAIGAQAAGMLLDLLESGMTANPCAEQQIQVIRGKLLARASTAPPPP